MSLVVRLAESADLEALIALNRVVQTIHASADPEFFRTKVDDAELRGFLDNLLSMADSFVVLAELEKRPAGYLWFDIPEQAATPFTHLQRRMRIHHLVVHEDARRRGVASALMEAARTMAVSRELREIVLNTWSFNATAQAFFRTAGFEPFSIAMRQRITSARACGEDI